MYEFDFNNNQFLHFTLEPSLVVLILIFFFVFFIYIFLKLVFKKELINKRNIIEVLFLGYLVGLIYLEFTPIQIWNTDYRDYLLINVLHQELLTFRDIASLDFLPFVSIIEAANIMLPELWFAFLRPVLGNLIILIPVPIFIGLFNEGSISIKRNVIIGIMFSLSLEISQLFINILTGWPNRVVSINDVILNTIGVISGAIIIAKYYSQFDKAIGKIHKFLRW